MTTARTVWKKLVHAAAWIADGIFILLAAAFKYATPRKRPSARHAVPDDGQDWADVLRRIPSPLRKRTVPPAAGARVTAAVLGQMLAQPSVDPVAEGIPLADADQYMDREAGRYRSAFDREFPVLAGELAPLPWLQPTLPPLPEPVQDWRPHACGDVDRPTAILRAQAERETAGWAESDQAICLCGIDPDIPGEPITSEADCPAHGEADGPTVHYSPDAARRCTTLETRIACGAVHWAIVSDDPEQVTCDACHAMPIRADVPGPAEPASPHPPPGSPQAATPPAAPAGPGTPDDTVTDTAAVADHAFVNDVAARPLDWAAWLDLCLHGDMDTVKAVTHG